jgi:hypothetical protein
MTVVQGGKSIHVRAKRIIITIPPLVAKDFLGRLDLDSTEEEIFRKFKSFDYWTAVAREPAIPKNLNLQNVSPGNETTPYFYADLPATYFLRAGLAPHHYVMTYGTSARMEMTNEQVKAEMWATLQRLRAGGAFNATTTEDSDIVAFENHSPYELHVDAEDIRGGFYRKMYALQGHQNTWWTGAAWVSHDSSAIWQYTSGIVADVVASLNRTC